MEHVNNDLWRGSFKVDQIGFYEYGLEARTLPDKRKVTRFEKTFKVEGRPHLRTILDMVRDVPPVTG